MSVFTFYTIFSYWQVVDPWGTILAQAEGTSPGIIFAEIDLAHVAKIRQEMPVITHKIPSIISNIAMEDQSQDLDQSSSTKVTKVNEPNLLTIPDSFLDSKTFSFGPKISGKMEIVFLENSFARAFVNRKCVAPGRE